ncbi:MAG: flagellin [Phycisphaerales bacterium]|nr:flagellin [Phycisphaerales bacterium]
MSRINTNPASMIAQRNLTGNTRALNTTLERLSTGLRINRGKDDPAGLIASENLRAEKAALGAAISNAERTDQLVNIAEGGLQELSTLLTELRGLVTATANNAGVSLEEKQANQLQIDSILQTIDRLADSTNFQGVKLLNGNFDFTSNNVSAGVTDFRVNSAKLARGGTIDVQALVTTSAQQGTLFLSTNGNLNLNGGGNGLFTIEVNGQFGARELTFASGTTRAQIAAAINTYSDVTGVTADVYSSGASTNGVRLRSTNFGFDSFVSVRVVNSAGIAGGNTGIYTMQAQSGDRPDASTGTAFSTANAVNGIRDRGQNIEATVNGVAATSNGRRVRINTDFLDVELTFNEALATQRGVINAFTINGGGADFQLASNVDIAGKVAIGIQNVSSRKLGNTDVGFLNSLAAGRDFNVVDGDSIRASRVVDEAIRQVSVLRGRLGAFQKNVVGATIRNLSISLENSAAAESVIRDADFASETAALTRAQILSQAAQNSLGLANSQPQSALQLLRQ